MKYIKTFEGLFNWKKKDKEPLPDYKEALEYFSNNYTEMEYDPTIDMRSDHIYISFWMNNTLLSYMIDKKEEKYTLTDCQKDVENSPEEKKRTRMESYYLVVEITKKEYENYLKLSQDVSDFLDEKSDSEKSSIGPDGLNMKVSDYDLVKLSLDDKMSQVFKEYLNKKYEFEVGYHLWTANDKNEYVCERVDLTIKEVRIRPYLTSLKVEDKNTEFYAEIAGVDWEGKEFYIHFDEKSNSQYVDLDEKSSKLESRLILTRDDRRLTRKQKRDEDNKPFPKMAGGINVSPSKYNSIEFLTEVKNALIDLNEKLF